MDYPPVIILGMHRSGTSMLARILEEVGLFVGTFKESNHESRFFLKLNHWIFEQINASWDNPYNFRFINDHFKKQVSRVLDSHLKGMRRIEYLGPRYFLKYRDVRDMDRQWGWKDPRNTFTVDVWKEIFPEARMLHVYRHPIDVAESLRQREKRMKKEFSLNWKVKLRELVLHGNIQYQSSFRVPHMLEAIDLWEAYVNKAFSLDQEFGHRIFHVRYEDFVEKPEEILDSILSFIHFQVDRSKVLRAIRGIRVDRRYSFLKNQVLMDGLHNIESREIVRRLYPNAIVQKRQCKK